jgi:glycosyltransferase involved in cell wall biosynthesis
MKMVKVAIDGRFIPGSGGGVESLVLGLAEGFHNLDLPDVEITFVTYEGHNDWLRQYRSPSFKVAAVRVPPKYVSYLRRGRVWAIRRANGSYSALPKRDHVMDSVSADVVHFPFQGRGWVRKPYVYHPHDLQHRYLPEFFTKREIAWREIMYGEHCRRAAAVAVGTSWVKEDLMSKMHVPADKIFVVPLAPITAGITAVPATLPSGAPHRYVIYPAANWPHKNHEALFAAMALLREQGTDVSLVLTGPRPTALDLRALAVRAGVSDLVHDLGFVSQAELEVLISGAEAMVVPTLFEAASFPIWESFRLGTQVGCSSVTSLPRQVGDAALIFDPRSIPEMASVIRTLWADPEGRRARVERGRARLHELSWDKTARQFLALYRHLGSGQTQETDRELLSRTPVL